MTSSLYVPLSHFEILKPHKEEGLKLIYENLVQSGPAYKLVVHDSPEWVALKDKLPWPEMIEIIPNRKAEEYVKTAHEFVVPIMSSLGVYKRFATDGIKFAIEGTPEFDALARDHTSQYKTKYGTVAIEGTPDSHIIIKLNQYRKFLTYLLIAHDYSARILKVGFGWDDSFHLFPEKEQLSADLGSKQNRQLKEREKNLSEDDKSRVNFIEGMVNGYEKDAIPTLTVNRDARIFNDLMDLLEKEEVKALSQENSRYNLARVKKSFLKRKIRVLIGDVVKNEWFPYLAGGVSLSLSYFASLNDIEKVLSFLTGLAAKALSKYDFREFAPAIQSGDLFKMASVDGEGIIRIKEFPDVNGAIVRPPKA